MSGSTAVATLSELNNWPSCVGYFDQRKVFAGSNQTPTGIWLTQPGNYKNMNVSVIPRDDDAITETISAPPPGASTEVNVIRACVAMPSGLLVFSSGGAWQITSGTATGSLTPSTINAQAHAFGGISEILIPLPINYELLFVQEKGSIVRDMSYNYYINIYTGTDLSALSNHLFFGHKIVSWCWAEEPHKLIWAVREDGILLSMTYLKEQEIYAWTWHDTQGVVENVASISENGQNAVYMVVRRFIGAPLTGVWKRYVERLATRNYGANGELGIAADPALCWCVDAGLVYARQYPNATLLTWGTVGTNVQFITDDGVAVFAPTDVGKIIRGGGGVAQITSFVNSTWVYCTVLVPLSNTLPNDPTTPIPLPAGTWSCTLPVTSVSGLGHLEGKTVQILYDGNVAPPQVVTGGQVTLPRAATAVIVGLGFTWQLQTLPLNTGQPTTKGRRKNINSATAILHQSRGVQMGPDFSTLTRIKDRPLRATRNGQPAPLFTGEYRMNVNSKWNMTGQICLQGTDPVPATVLAVVPEVLVGDT